jgi:hypothetical protein
MSDHDGVLLESVSDKLDGLIEVVSVMHERLTKVETTSNQILEVVTELYPLKAETADHQDKLTLLQKRVEKLEMPARA